ncbi:alpha-galactosidase [Kutzneria albida]|uniref:alpha-galactosidase n=1 Tax=Kutzneria albida DSM 43870 TaxID=1449976 RepID=W5WFY5_9PSEU|nr:alpha-galactosidase [Kutzneria albida]AHH99521.1 hypothetical protein KALB_6161 [Kutzneria albida DSM 43870]
MIVALRGAGTSLVVRVSEPVPEVLHWGADLGDLSEEDLSALELTGQLAVLNNSVDSPRVLSVWPTQAEGWLGTPAHQGHSEGTRSTPRPRLTGYDLRGEELVLRLDDAVSEVDIELSYRLTGSGVLAVRSRLTARAPYELTGVTTLVPLPPRATEILDFTGKWCRERAPQRTALGHGAHVREVRRGKPGQDSPYLLVVGVPGFRFGAGEVWGLHVAWSGDQRYLVEQLPESTGVLGGGELLRPGAVRLAAGESYESPTCYLAWSDTGLDGLAHRLHAMQRGTPRGPRPLVLNTWEAVYFDHDLDRLRELTTLGAQVGVERVVLDDGWFLGRRDDRAGLGDWTVDPQVWPRGLHPLVDHVRGLGMQFGLWVEPEMVNLDSRLAREHPDWVIGPVLPSRNQQVLDLANPDAWAYLLESLDDLVGEYAIDYLKWDHNRDLLEADAHAQTHALYRLIDALRARHPALEIESCASGGGRVDLGILARTDRVWASDCNDPVERQHIQRWTGQLVPPELVGSHVGPARCHTTGRVTEGSFRMITALFGHAGIEQDLTRCTPEELDDLRRWAALYRELRPLLHSGRVVRADLPDEATLLHGVVGAESAIYCWARTETSAPGQSGRVRLPGLDPRAAYRVRVRTELGLPSMRQVSPPAWIGQALRGWVRLPGAVLTGSGVALPVLDPQQAMLIEVAGREREVLAGG